MRSNWAVHYMQSAYLGISTSKGQSDAPRDAALDPEADHILMGVTVQT